MIREREREYDMWNSLLCENNGYHNVEGKKTLFNY